MRRPKWGQALFCFLFVVGFAAKAEAARLRLSVPVHGVSHVAFYAAKEKGYFQEEGLDVEVILMSGAIGIRALIAGDVDASTVGGSALPPIFRGAPLRMVFISFDKPTHWLYAKPDIRTVKDLKGRKVAVDGLGGTLESLLRWVLEKNGLEAGRDVPILAIGPPPGRFVALTSGAIDATLFTFPLNFRAEEAGFRELVNFVKQDIASLTGCIVVRESSDAGLVERLVRGAVKGHLYARNNRAGTIPIFARALKIKEDVATKIYDAALPGMVADGSINEESQRRVIDDTRKSLGAVDAEFVDQVTQINLVGTGLEAVDGIAAERGQFTLALDVVAEDIVARLAEHDVGALAAIQGVVAGPALQDVGIALAQQLVVAGATEQRIGAVSGSQEVIAGTAVELVG